MILYIKEVDRIKTYFGDYSIVFYLLDDHDRVLNRCVSSSPEWARYDLLRGHDEWEDAEIKFI